MLVPMLDLTLELAAADRGREVVIGMAHRGRLNVLAHIIGRPYETIFAEFEGGRFVEGNQFTPEGGTGDVKYHHGAEGAFPLPNGKSIAVTLSPNPSHLEFVSPVVDGRARATQTLRKGRTAHHDPAVALPVLIHGDAAFAGTGRGGGNAQPRARCRATASAARCTSSPTTRSASPPTWKTRARPGTPAISRRGSTCRSST